ncbi:PLP-dependent aminotransferase family protein [Pseudotabrizicola alkalilacus]|uniref:PLP-dependent aminotransferase family protein n=1 Tax=Pseudotabrizicola alkalilacus TaxID=2305252 RepID=A0A411Z0I9_9RHOB|nr:PLP-dependent aminotransferase family protein [Pseudotabrizicola alkalilacus]RGP36576.1 PLP-dependent aminotransferase family protein [Pseudotabrizicola alkalilacus]
MTHWMPDPATLSRPAYLSLAEQFARAIETGALAAGARLMPHRKLADTLGLSVQTVSRAYDELIRRGLIAGEVGRGSFVLDHGAEARQPYLPERPGEVIDLSILKPVVEEMQFNRLRNGFAWLAENMSAPSALSFRPNVVMPHHRAVAADWLMRQGIPAEASGIALTNGATPAITAAVMAVVPPGAGLAAAALTHHTLKPLCTYLGLHLDGVAMDGGGMLPGALDELARKGTIRAVYVQPNVINPLGIMMSESRRAELVAVARRHDLAIIENDILSVMIPDRVATFAALAPERTLYICGFTKITVPGLRLAYLHAPTRYASAVANRHLVVNWMATPPMADLLSHWITDGTVAELAAWQAQAMSDRHTIAADVLGSLMPACHGNSLHLWMRLPEAWSEERFVEQARLRGVAVAAGGAFRASDKVRGEAIRISLGSTRHEDLRRGLSVVAALLRDAPEALLPTI